MGGQQAGPHCIRLGFTVCMIFSAGKKNFWNKQGKFSFSHFNQLCVFVFYSEFSLPKITLKFSNNKTNILTVILINPLVLNKGKYLSTDIWNVFFLIIS